MIQGHRQNSIQTNRVRPFAGDPVLLIEKTVGWGTLGFHPKPRQGDHPRNLNRRPGHCRARASFRLTPPVRFALRASAHRAHANLRPPAPRSLGLRPKGTMSLGAFLCFGSEFPFGATPQAPREGLELGQEKYAKRAAPWVSPQTVKSSKEV